MPHDKPGTRDVVSRVRGESKVEDREMSKRSVEAVVTAMGQLLAIVVALVAAIKKRGVDVGEAFCRLASADGAATIDKIAELIVGDTIPCEITVGCRTYEVLPVLREGDGGTVNGDTMITRAKEMSANLGEKDGQHLLAHQAEIPASLRGKVAFVFTDWRRPDDFRHVASVYWDGGRWIQSWYWLGCGFSAGYRVLRRK